MKLLKKNKLFQDSKEKTGDLDKQLQDRFDKINERLQPSWERLKKAGQACQLPKQEPAKAS